MSTRVGSAVCLTTFVAASMVILLQMWFEIFSAEVFGKTLVTLGIFFAVVLGATLVFRENAESRRLREAGYID